MTKEQIKAVLDRVLTWSLERQQDAVQVLSSIEAQDQKSLRLSAEQAAEIRRRRAEPLPPIPAEEVFRRFRSPDS